MHLPFSWNSKQVRLADGDGAREQEMEGSDPGGSGSVRLDRGSQFQYGLRNAYRVLHWRVIVSYRDKRSSDFAAGRRVKALSGIERPARLKLDRLEAATMLRDLSALPGNRFESLAGDRKGQYSIRINDQWRICFEWPDGVPGPSNVEIVDYH